ncbi:hypothetical protein [Mesonia maritima]|uniref:Uncharacterized protein n=1 Tax=Mesonia maritima TaxID=1793873 RepID=A0ABU1K616_9FLAO|nr:hypothetical protein [Mesonia maritima]MDR6301050.1 hypothetical protein [Mesonia maritima]
MEIKNIQRNRKHFTNKKLKEFLYQFQQLLIELNKKDLPENTKETINKHLEKLNSKAVTIPEKKYLKVLRNCQKEILLLLEENHKLVPRNHYKEKFLFLFMAIFSLPLSLLWGKFFNKIAVFGLESIFGFLTAVIIGITLTVGLPIISGLIIGMNKDRKASKVGRQLEIELG